MKVSTLFGNMLHSLFIRPATRSYPQVRTTVPERLRGRLVWRPVGCTGCSLCVKDCPADAIQLIDIDRANKQFKMRYHVDRCTFCGQCVQSCRFNCLELAHDQWELATVQRNAFVIEYGEEGAL